MNTVAEIIQSRVSLGKMSATGFQPTRCPICHDHSARMGIKFEHSLIGVNCFNCGFKAVYNDDDKKLSRDFKKLLRAIGVSDEEITRLAAQSFFRLNDEPEKITLQSIRKVNLYTPEVKLPEGSVRMDGTNFPLETAYLRSRLIEPTSYPFYVCNDKQFKNRVIIPFYRNGKVIYWQARSTMNAKPRYLNCEVSKEAVMFNTDRLYAKQLTPLYITEGVMDALLVNGLSIIGSKLNEAKATLLAQSKRELIFVIDPDKNGLLLAETVVEYDLGKLTFVGGTEDVNSSILKYGKLWTYYQLAQNVRTTDFEQKLFLSNLKSRT